MKNSKGQTLVLFVLLLPVLLLVLGFLIEFGLLQIEKRKIENTINNALTYGMEHKEEETVKQDIHKLLILNLKTVEDEIIIEENTITIQITKKVKSIFQNFFSNQQNIIKMKKRINVENGKHYIIKE